MKCADIGARIREARKAAGMTQEQLAEAVELSPQYVGQVERGCKTPRLETLDRIAHIFGVPLVQLLWSEKTDTAVVALLDDCTDIENAVILEVVQAIKKSLRKNCPSA